MEPEEPQTEHEDVVDLEPEEPQTEHEDVVDLVPEEPQTEHEEPLSWAQGIFAGIDLEAMAGDHPDDYDLDPDPDMSRSMWLRLMNRGDRKGLRGLSKKHGLGLGNLPNHDIVAGLRQYEYEELNKSDPPPFTPTRECFLYIRQNWKTAKREGVTRADFFTREAQNWVDGSGDPNLYVCFPECVNPEKTYADMVQLTSPSDLPEYANHGKNLYEYYKRGKWWLGEPDSSSGEEEFPPKEIASGPISFVNRCIYFLECREYKIALKGDIDTHLEALRRTGVRVPNRGSMFPFLPLVPSRMFYEWLCKYGLRPRVGKTNPRDLAEENLRTFLEAHDHFFRNYRYCEVVFHLAIITDSAWANRGEDFDTAIGKYLHYFETGRKYWSVTDPLDKSDFPMLQDKNCDWEIIQMIHHCRDENYAGYKWNFDAPEQNSDDEHSCSSLSLAQMAVENSTETSDHDLNPKKEIIASTSPGETPATYVDSQTSDHDSPEISSTSSSLLSPAALVAASTPHREMGECTTNHEPAAENDFRVIKTVRHSPVKVACVQAPVVMTQHHDFLRRRRKPRASDSHELKQYFLHHDERVDNFRRSMRQMTENARLKYKGSKKYTIHDKLKWKEALVLPRTLDPSNNLHRFYRGDAVSLCCEKYVNDNVVEYFMKYLLNQRINRRKCKVCMPPIISKFVEMTTGSVLSHDIHDNHIVRCAERAIPIGFFKDKGFLLVPVNYPLNVHWMLVIVHGQPSRKIFLEIRDDSDDSKNPVASKRWRLHVAKCVAAFIQKVLTMREEYKNKQLEFVLRIVPCEHTGRNSCGIHVVAQTALFARNLRFHLRADSDFVGIIRQWMLQHILLSNNPPL